MLSLTNFGTSINKLAGIAYHKRNAKVSNVLEVELSKMAHLSIKIIDKFLLLGTEK